MDNFFAVITCLIFLCSLSDTQKIPVLTDGNNDVPIDHVPFVASLRMDDVDESFFGKGHFCTGVFIARKSVLTLASCFYQNDALVNPEEVRIIGGTKYRYAEEYNTFSSLLEEIIIHENFSRSSLENNIAIGILLTKLPSNNAYLYPINEISSQPPDEEQKLKIYGWSLSTRFEVSPHLLEGDVVVTSLDFCDPQYNKITTNTICCSPYHVNGCETDDGGPLVESISGFNLLYGLIDFRSVGYCSRIITNRLGTYVDVSPFYDWINEHKNSSKRASINLVLLVFVIFMISFKI